MFSGIVEETGHVARIDTAGHTELERAVMQQPRWFTRAELADWPERIFPADVLDLLDLAEELA